MDEKWPKFRNLRFFPFLGKTDKAIVGRSATGKNTHTQEQTNKPTNPPQTTSRKTAQPQTNPFWFGITPVGRQNPYCSTQPAFQLSHTIYLISQSACFDHARGDLSPDLVPLSMIQPLDHLPASVQFFWVFLIWVVSLFCPKNLPGITPVPVRGELLLTSLLGFK